ncbi:MAG: NADH-quinone oxidoreductase subunit C [Candidatus Dadabacteria bacterium]|nr:NADH-quinone oxidoreductase subunit C [Candidatus Dadabacteria bacterium]
MTFEPQTALDSINRHKPSAILEVTEFRGETTLLINKLDLHAVASHLKRNHGFVFLADITAVDYLGLRNPRYEVLYVVHRFGEGFEDNARLNLRIGVPEDRLRATSVTNIWKGADWLEREVYDMFGIVFEGHPDLRRILMPDDYDYFPLRKDFDVRNREPSKRCFERELEAGKLDFRGSLDKPLEKSPNN